MPTPDEKKFVHFVAFDIDGCILPEDWKNSTMIEANRSLWQMLKRQGKHAFAATFTMLFSSRQSQGVDEGNRKNKALSLAQDPTSSYVPLKLIAEEALDSTHCPVLLSDHYSQQPDGHAYVRAVTRAHDKTVYHPGCVFDQNKTGLLYTQAHIAANNMRNCDFLSVASRPAKLLQLPFKSNAAYLFVADEKTLLYVNKAEQKIEPLVIANSAALLEMRTLVDKRIADEEHDFEALPEKGNQDIIKGITLSDAEITKMTAIASHVHIKQDYLIMYEAFEDRQDILHRINETYKDDNSVLLPQNVIVRLNRYSVDNFSGNYEYCTIRGTGPIDLKPKETLVKMAKHLLGKEVIQDRDFTDDNCFMRCIAGYKSASWFTTRTLTMPKVKLEKSHETYAPVLDYGSVLPPEQIAIIREFIKSKQPSSWPSLSLPSLFRFARNNKIKDAKDKDAKNIPPAELLDALQTLQSLMAEEALPKTLAKVMAAKDYNMMISPGSTISTLLRELNRQYLQQPAAAGAGAAAALAPDEKQQAAAASAAAPDKQQSQAAAPTSDKEQPIAAAAATPKPPGR